MFIRESGPDLGSSDIYLLTEAIHADFIPVTQGKVSGIHHRNPTLPFITHHYTQYTFPLPLHPPPSEPEPDPKPTPSRPPP